MRVADWPEQLSRYIDSRRDEPFAWGRADCAMFLADWIVIARGEDLAKRWRKYKTAKGAAAIIKHHGDMKNIAIQAGLIEKHRGLAQRGDGVLAVLEGRETFGVVVGNGMWCGPGETGLVFRPLDGDVITAFEV